MKRLKAAFKAALIPAIIGIVISIVGILLFIIIGIGDMLTGAFVGIPVLALGIGVLAIAYSSAKQRLHAICPDCEKFMGNTDKQVEYSFACNQYKANHDNNGKFLSYTFYYTCTIVCPHCGATSVFEYKVNAKTEPKANETVNNYLKNTLKLNK